MNHISQRERSIVEVSVTIGSTKGLGNGDAVVMGSQQHEDGDTRQESEPAPLRARSGRRRLGHMRRVWFRYGIFWLGAVTVGLVAVGYAHLIDFGYAVFRRMGAGHPWLPLIITPVIGGFSVWLTRKYFRGAEGSGIPQVIAVLHSPKEDNALKLLTLRIVLGKIFVSFLAIVGGFTIGREGPTVHVGAAILYNFRRLYPKRLSINARMALERRLVLAGAASGLAAAFNTPLAGIVFAIEELSRGFETRAARVTVTAIIFSGLIALSIDGNYTYFGTISIGTLSVGPAIAGVVLAAIVSGLAGGGFAWLSINPHRWLPRYLLSLRENRPVLFGMACGVAVAVVGVATGGHTFGSGYAEARGLVEGHSNLSALYPVTKLVSLVASYLAGAPGGIFAPSLAIGAGIGQGLHELVSQIPAQVAIALAMVGYLAAVTQSPITAFIIVTEMNDAHVLIIPLMATAVIASTVSRMVAPPLYETLANKYS